MRLDDIVMDLRKVDGVELLESFFELEKMSVQHPDLEYVHWYVCNACGRERRSCASPFAPDECLQMYDDVEPVWNEIPWESMKVRGIQKGDARFG